MNESTVSRTNIESPVGRLLVGASDKGIVGLYYEGVHRRQPEATKMWTEGDSRFFREVREQLAAYFAGQRQSFNLELDMSGSPFYRTVWSELQIIPYGETISYAELAARAGSPKAVRAVGMANARNPVSIIVPCHRVVATNGKLTGYAGGVDTKRRLLELEGAMDGMLI